ncbi:MAG: hypothetical protein IT460_09145 [Planctomycetes bacterium]|nr:hypothetical protein [Planctomycetota bacterium]
MRVLPWVLAAVVGAAAWLGVRSFLGGEAPPVVADDPEPTGPAPLPAVVPTPEKPPVPSPVARGRPFEAVWDAAETFPERDPLVAPVMVAVTREVLTGPGDMRGATLLEVLEASGLVWVRWDSEEVGVRVRRAELPRPNPHLGLDGRPAFLLDEVRAILRARGYTNRLDGHVLRVGGADAYPADEPPAPSPR